MLFQKIFGFDMISDAIFKQKKSLPMPNQYNIELFLKVSYCKRNLSRQFPKVLTAGVTCVPHIYTISRLLDLLNLKTVRPV